MLSELIIECIEKYLPDCKFPTNYLGKWRYQNWECDIEKFIWSIHFGKYKLTSKVKYERDLSKINTFLFHFKFNNTLNKIEINNKNIFIIFEAIKEFIEIENAIKASILEVNNKIKKINNSDKEILREIKLNKIFNKYLED